MHSFYSIAGLWAAFSFLHYGYNYWCKRATRELIDSYTVLDGSAWPEWMAGDTFMVHPRPEGPIDSLRFEVFAEAPTGLPTAADMRDRAKRSFPSPIRSFGDFLRGSGMPNQASRSRS